MSLAILRTSTASLAITSGSLRLPLRGLWSAFLEVDLDAAEDPPVGPVDIVIAGDEGSAISTFRGTILPGEAVSYEGRGRLLVHAGAGTAANTKLSARDYLKSPFDVPVSLIVADAVADADELLADGVTAELEGFSVPRWHRNGDDSAASVLQRLADRLGLTWRFDDDGALRVRTEETWDPLDADTEAKLVQSGLDDAFGRTLDVTPPAATLRPGQTVLGKRIEEVVYRITEQGLRAELHYGPGDMGTAGDLRSAVRAAMPPLLYREMHAGTVRRQNADGTLDIEADEPRVGTLSSVPMKVGIVGARSVVSDGERCTFGWQDGNEALPVVVALDADASAARGIARINDTVGVGSIQFVAAPDGSGGIASIAVVYTPPLGSPVSVVIAPGAPVQIPLSGAITSASEEAFLRG